MRRLTIVTRRDLSPGQQAVQGMHALVEYLRKHKESSDSWYKESNTLAFLSVANLQELQDLEPRADASFYEPDLKGPDGKAILTAIAFSDRTPDTVGLNVALKRCIESPHPPSPKHRNAIPPSS